MLTALIFGVGLFVVCNVFALYKFTLIEALLFGSIISATDPVATISVNKLLGLNKNLNAVIFGESVLNDAISIAMFKVFSSFVADKDIAWIEVVRDFGYLFFGSISIGLLAGVFISVLFKLFRFSPVLDTAIFFLWIYVPYLISEAVDMSGILAILFSGMVTGYYAKES
jgi:NhaP-type Na+/H+ or K+/H+ antiporter